MFIGSKQNQSQKMLLIHMILKCRPPTFKEKVSRKVNGYLRKLRTYFGHMVPRTQVNGVELPEVDYELQLSVLLEWDFELINHRMAYGWQIKDFEVIWGLTGRWSVSYLCSGSATKMCYTSQNLEKDSVRCFSMDLFSWGPWKRACVRTRIFSLLK